MKGGSLDNPLGADGCRGKTECLCSLFSWKHKFHVYIRRYPPRDLFKGPNVDRGARDWKLNQTLYLLTVTFVHSVLCSRDRCKATAEAGLWSLTRTFGFKQRTRWRSHLGQVKLHCWPKDGIQKNIPSKIYMCFIFAKVWLKWEVPLAWGGWSYAGMWEVGNICTQDQQRLQC